MALRTYWKLATCVNRCCYTNIRHPSLKTETLRSYQQIREFKRLVRSAKNESHASNASQSRQEPLVWSRLWKPLVFTVSFTGGAFAIASIAEHERIKKYTQWFIYPHEKPYKSGELRQQLHDYWASLPDSQKIYSGIFLLNALVCCAWRIPRCQGLLKKYFTASPSSRTLCLPMLLSTFSHVELWHFAINMYVLHTFATVAVAALGKEQFLAMYLSAGVFANLMSYAYKIARKSAVSTVGASGSIAGVFAFIALQYPSLNFSIIFLPMFRLTATQTLYGFLAIETIACLRGLSFMDHAGHLGGALFGMMWQSWGRDTLWPLRIHILALWEDLHENFRIRK